VIKSEDKVVLRQAVFTLPYKGRPQRKVQPGVVGYVERTAAEGSVLRIVVYDADDGRSDVCVVARSKVELV
jgi:hypothetical protein